MSLTPIEQVRLITQDNTPGLYIVSDDELQYFLDRNNGNINLTVIDVAKVILLNLSMRTDSTVDILSLKGSKTAEQFRLSLETIIKNQYLNPILANVNVYAGNISKEDYQNNLDNVDNMSVVNPTSNVVYSTTADDSNPFSI